MEERELSYAADGIEMTGVVVDGSNGKPTPGVLVAHEAPGRDPRMTVWARKLADKGFVAFAMGNPPISNGVHS